MLGEVVSSALVEGTAIVVTSRISHVALDVHEVSVACGRVGGSRLHDRDGRWRLRNAEVASSRRRDPVAASRRSGESTNWRCHLDLRGRTGRRAGLVTPRQ